MQNHMLYSFAPEWEGRIGAELSKDYFKNIREKICQDMLAGHAICPTNEHIFRVFRLVDYGDIKVVILGQDPYYAESNQANGLAFAVGNDVAIPSSLRNIFKEIAEDIGEKPTDRTLVATAKQGVFWLNTALTTRLGEAYAHGDLWKHFTNKIISELNARLDPIVFMLWGNKAKVYKSLIDTTRHYVLEAAHPSGLSASRGFYQCRHFSRANEILRKLGKTDINWVAHE